MQRVKAETGLGGPKGSKPQPGNVIYHGCLVSVASQAPFHEGAPPLVVVQPLVITLLGPTASSKTACR